MTCVKPETRSFYELAVQKAVEQVISNLDRALDLQAVARAAALSPFHFHRVFRGMLGETPLELHRRLRMERAAWSLLHEDIPLSRVRALQLFTMRCAQVRAWILAPNVPQRLLRGVRAAGLSVH